MRFFPSCAIPDLVITVLSKCVELQVAALSFFFFETAALSLEQVASERRLLHPQDGCALVFCLCVIVM
jgi:hypothetical protein